MLPAARDPFEHWKPGPVGSGGDGSPLVFRRSHPDDFERIYDLVDAVYGRRRPRAVFDWLYRRNPLGPARCWLVTERDRNRLLAAAVYWPWPLAHGRRSLRGALAGDSVVAPEWQRRGVRSALYSLKAADPGQTDLCSFGWPNEKSARLLRKLGAERALLGPLREAWAPTAATHGLRRLAARLAPRRHGPGVVRCEEMDGFPDDLDPVTARWSTHPGIWSPHAARFLRWRYREHPLHEHRGLAALRDDRLLGYAVVRVGGRAARLMELVAPDDAEVTAALLRAAREAAGEAGCRRIGCFAPPAWHHWPALSRSDFRSAGTGRMLRVNAPGLAEAQHLDTWRLLPGDSDSE